MAGKAGQGGDAGVSSLEVQATQLKASSLAQCLRGPGHSASRSGVVLLPSPVDVLEEGHGEGHAQNLKDTGPRGLRWGPRGHPAPAGEPLSLCRRQGV